MKIITARRTQANSSSSSATPISAIWLALRRYAVSATPRLTGSPRRAAG